MNTLFYVVSHKLFIAFAATKYINVVANGIINLYYVNGYSNILISFSPGYPNYFLIAAYLIPIVNAFNDVNAP